jgi:hypothetical protein
MKSISSDAVVGHGRLSIVDKWIHVSSKLYWVDLEISKSIEESTFIRIKSLDVCTEKS